MEPVVVVACITVLGGGVFAILQKLIDKKYGRAKDQIEENTAEVENMTKVLAGMEALMNQLRTRNEELEEENRRLRGDPDNGDTKTRKR